MPFRTCESGDMAAMRSREGGPKDESLRLAVRLE